MKRLTAAWFVLVVCGLGSVAPSLSQETPAMQFQKLTDDVWEFDLHEDPLWATHYGDTRFNDRLPSETLEDQQRRLAALRVYRKRQQAMDRKSLSKEEQLNFDIFAILLDQRIGEYEFESYLTPITNRWGFHVAFPELPQDVPLETALDYRNYVARLNAFARYVDDHVELMREGVKQGRVLPAVVLEGVEDTVKPHIVADPKQSLLFSPFTTFPDRIPAAEREALATAGVQAIQQSVVPGYQKFLTFLQKEYLPAARPTVSISALPKGREYYQHCVRKFTTLDMSPEQIHELGLSEVKRIRQEMQTVMKQTGFTGEFPAFIEHLRTDPKFYPQTPEQLMKEVAFVLKRMDGELPRLFKTLPRMSYGIRPVPDYIAPKTTTAYYSQPAGDGTRAGFYYVNTYNLKSRPLYEIEALSLHEAVPGHHLQLALQQELTNLPNYRRFSGFTAFIEGWGLYAERLGLEVGFYQDPYSQFGRLSYEMWRACRLVVDTGVHHLGWTRQQAIDFMAQNTALTLHNITAEVDRYISWPGQALAYKIGELKIRELRQLAETALGAKFDVREFHDVVLLSGSVPLRVLESNVKAYITQHQPAP